MSVRLTVVCSVIPLIAAAALAAPPALQLPAGAQNAAALIDRGTLEGPVRFLADDLLEGRAPSHPGDEVACRYAASVMEALGLEPGAPGGRWEQRFEIVGITTSAPPTWTFRSGGKETALRYWDDFIAASGVQAPEVSIPETELVFVGYGIQAPEYRWDDFKGADVKGKILVMMNNDPDWDPSLFAGTRRLYYGRWSYKYESAARQGAAGAIIIHTTPSAGYGWKVVQNSWTGEQFELPAAGEPRIQVRAWTTEDATRRVLAAAGFDLDALVKKARSRDFRPVPLGITTSLRLVNALKRGETANVLGLIRGRDPVLKDQVVVFSAHHDHLGVGKPDAKGDTIYTGAVDNATGVAQVLAIAKAFMALPERPRRSILFAIVSCEESGLLGSAYYAAHPTFPPDKIAADINFDAGNIFGKTRDVALVGKGKSSLDAVAEAAAALQGRVVTDEAFPDRGAYYRSDHFSFARIGVPGLYFKGGLDYVGRDPGWGRKVTEEWGSAHYHQPSDEWSESWNFDGMIEDSQLGFFAGLAVADADVMPTWVPGDEFAGVRAAAHAAN
ncbi:MAG TPA: M28 family metallopeptidase [Thermoanaerobaculaceae bacterium]|nr:M28 family metallopeptidase [Thermoanaerobaculaceae bacterium]